MDVLQTLIDAGAVDDGSNGNHYVYKSGKHGPGYINMDPLFPDIWSVKEICRSLAEPFGFGQGFDAVVGAATGGIPLAYLTASISGVSTACWADKAGQDFAFERDGFARSLQGKRVLFVEDLLNTGDTTRKVIHQIRKCGGEVVSVTCICNRGKQTASSLDVPKLISLCEISLKAYEPSECSQCADEIAIVTDVAHGNDFQSDHPKYAGGFKTLLS
jgi:orotate phosphoribosyltransferase